METFPQQSLREAERNTARRAKCDEAAFTKELDHIAMKASPNLADVRVGVAFIATVLAEVLSASAPRRDINSFLPAEKQFEFGLSVHHSS